MEKEDDLYRPYQDVEIDLLDINTGIVYKAKALFIRYRGDKDCLVQFNGVLLLKPLNKIKAWTDSSMKKL